MNSRKYDYTRFHYYTSPSMRKVYIKTIHKQDEMFVDFDFDGFIYGEYIQ